MSFITSNILTRPDLSSEKFRKLMCQTSCPIEEHETNLEDIYWPPELDELIFLQLFSHKIVFPDTTLELTSLTKKSIELVVLPKHLRKLTLE